MKFKTVHNDKYDYTLVDYKRMNKTVKIICQVHGVFEQLPEKHLLGHNCPKCSGSFMNSEYFEEKSRRIHGDKYGYSKVIYVNNRTNVILTCKEHGDFNQLPSNHLLGRGCSKCGSEKRKVNYLVNSK